MEVSKEPTKIDPPWKRALYLAIFVVGTPLLVYGIGYLGGLLWKIFRLGIAHAAY